MLREISFTSIERVDVEMPLEHGGETSKPQKRGGETSKPQKRGGETSKPQKRGGETSKPQKRGASASRNPAWERFSLVAGIQGAQDIPSCAPAVLIGI